MHVPCFEIVFEDAVFYSNCPVFADYFHGFYAMLMLEGECRRCLVASHPVLPVFLGVGQVFVTRRLSGKNLPFASAHSPIGHTGLQSYLPQGRH